MAVGWQSANALLFLEAYLDRPIERALAAQVQQDLPCTAIVGIGSLGASHPKGAVTLFQLLASRVPSPERRGSYYDTQPWVVAGSLQQGMQQGASNPLLRVWQNT